MLAPPVVLHFPGSPAPIHGIAAAKHLHTTNSTPFADFQITVEDQMAEGDKVVSRWVMQGTRTGDFQGLPPTGKTVQMTGISIDRIAGGKIVEQCTLRQSLGMVAARPVEA